MDFGVVGHKQTSPDASCLGSSEPRDDKGHGSSNLKNQRSLLVEDNNNNTWRLSKMPRPGELGFSFKKASEGFSTPFGRSNPWPSPEDDDGQRMLSFSSEAPHCIGGGGSTRSIAFSICQDEHYSRAGGGGLSGGIRGPSARLKGPFTPSQWMELEHQALIYKHIIANVPVPSNLLVPLKRSLYTYGPPGSYASNLLGWGPFHLGYSGSSNDPEPGRCRRTDGKKWRCSRDAVPDQKYCERHINRGRHRSRKPVEGQTGRNASKLPPINAPSSSCLPAAPMMSSSNATNNFSAMQNQFSSLHHPNSHSAPTDHLVSRSQGFQQLSLKPKDASFSVQKQQHSTYEESSNSEFGIVPSDSLVNPSSSGRISYMNSNNSDSFLQFDVKEANNQQHSVHHFIDDWSPKGQSGRTTSGPWLEEPKSDWTRLSMSIPVAPDFSCSSSSPRQAKSIPTLKLSSHEPDSIHTGLGVGCCFNDPIQKQPSWLPVAWGNPMGGPLGEVLSSQLGSSPTGVLQKSTFVSLSNSSTGSSSTSGDNKKASGNGILCNDLLGSALVSSAAIPSL
ncbi:hypothetical protein OROHE_002549 [Orobanche hederae]